MDGQTTSPLPKYQSHKEVWALKIKSIQLDSELAQKENRETDGGAFITPEEAFKSIKVSHEYMRKHNPQIGGYYVRYQDGYESFSPAGVFEAGYTLIE